MPDPYEDPEVRTADAAPLRHPSEPVSAPVPHVSWTSAALLVSAAVLLLVTICTA